MRMKPKTARRLALLAGVVVIGAGGFVGLVLVRGAQNARLEAGLRFNGMAAHNEGNDVEALHTLGRYLRRAPEDAEALLAYAESRLAVEEADGRHVREAVGVYQRYIDLRHDDRDAKIALLHLYNQSGLFLEARKAAEDLRPSDLSAVTPEHADILFEEGTALLGLTRVDASFQEVVDALTMIGDDTRAALLQLEGLARSGMDPSVYAAELLAEAPDDPRWIIVDVIARSRDAGDEERAELVEQAAGAFGIDPQTGEAVGELRLTEPLMIHEGVSAFDRLERFDLAIAALQRVRSVVDDSDLERLLARRLVQAGRFEDLAATFEWEDVREADTVLIAMRAIGALGVGDERDAAGLIEELASRADADYRARAWSSALRLATPDGAETVSDRVAQLRKAIETHPGEPLLSNMLATSLAELGREDEAIEVWSNLLRSPRAAGWMSPRIKLAEQFLETGQIMQAMAVAQNAVETSPGNALANAVFFDAMSQVVRTGVDIQINQDLMLGQLANVRAGVEAINDDGAREIADRLLVSHVRLLCGFQRADEAAAVVREAIGGFKKPSEGALHALSTVSRQYGLGLESDLLAAASDSFGPTPGVLFAQALDLAKTDGVDAALALFDEAAAVDVDNARGWSIARAKLLEGVDRPEDALAAWRALMRTYSDDVEVVKLVLESPIVTRDWDLIEDAAAQYRALTNAREGDTSVLVATARARGLLHGRPSRRERDEAIALLEQAATEREGAVEIRRLLAEAHLLNDPSRDISPDLAAAARELENASHLAPGDASIAFALAQVLQRRREFAGASEILDRLAKDPTLNQSWRLLAIRLLIDQGEETIARRSLAALDSAARTTNDPSVTFELASAYERLGDDGRALAQYELLVGMDLQDPEIIAGACAAFERAKRADLAGRMIKQLSSLELSKAELAFYHGWRAERTGRDLDAIELYRESVELDPTDRRSHVALVSLLLANGEIESALDAAHAANEAVPDDSRLSVLIEQARFAASGQSTEDMASLIEAMRRDPHSARLGEALAAVQHVRDAGKLDDPEAIRELIQHHRDTLAIQLFGAARLAQIDRALAAEAVGVAEQAMRTFPDAPEPARLAAELNMSLGRWEAMIAAARAWKQRDLTGPVEADLAMAQAHLRLGRPQQAIDTLVVHVKTAGDSLESAVDLGIINIYTQALVATGRVDQAMIGLETLLDRSAAVRALIALPIGAALANDPAQAEAWLDTVYSHMPQDAADEQVAMAAALSSLGRRLGEPDNSRLVREALDVLHGLVARDLATSLVLESIGKMHHTLGELDAAGSAYRQALDADSDLVDSLNNLATIILAQDGDPGEAITLATRAVELAGPKSTAELDTLANAQSALASTLEKRGLREPAATTYGDAADNYLRVLEINPGQPEVLWSFAHTSAKAGRIDEAIRAYEQVLATGSSIPDLVAAAENNLALLLLEHRGDPGAVDRAYGLALSAASESQNASFHETLGRASWAAGKRDVALKAYRTALELRPDMIDAMLGLADVLASGDEAAQAEADSLVQRVERMIEDGAEVDPSTLRKLEQLNSRFSAVD